MNNKTLKTWINTHPMEAFTLWCKSRPFLVSCGTLTTFNYTSAVLDVEFTYTEDQGAQHEVTTEDILEVISKEDKKQILKKYI